MSTGFDVIILGAGAAGLMCAITAGARGRRVLLLDHAEAAGKKMFTVILRDVTERKRAEEVQERLAAIVASSDDAIISKSLDGTITTRTAGLNKLISKNTDDQAALNSRVDAFQARLVSQYTALDAKVAQLNSLSAYVTQQVAQWNKQN